MMTDKRIWELLARQFSGEITPDELQELESLLARHAEKAPFGELLSDVRELELHPDAADIKAKERSLDNIRRNIETPGPPPLKRKRLGWFVLAVMMALPIGWWLWRPFHPVSAEPFDKIATKAGSRTRIDLPDSSTVILTSACQFSYNKNFGVRKREMHLSGEAWFNIHSNPDIPLVVHAGDAVIRVLGTTFNVRANPGDSFVEATLLSGAIEISLQSDPERKILLRPGEKIVIRNGKDSSIAASSGNRHKLPDVFTVSHTSPHDTSFTDLSWPKEKERLQFHKERFGSLVLRLEQRYNVRIILTDPGLQDLLFTGSFENESVEEALQALRSSAPFDYLMENDTIRITQRKK